MGHPRGAQGPRRDPVRADRGVRPSILRPPLIVSDVFEQDAVVHVVAAEFVRRHASHPAKQPIGVFRLRGPGYYSDYLPIADSCGEGLQAGVTAYTMSSEWGQNPEVLCRAGLVRGKAVTLVDYLKVHPGSLVVFTSIQAIHPQILAQLQSA